MPVAIHGSTIFDVRTVDPDTLTLAGAAVRTRGNGVPMVGFEDVDGDGRIDMVVHFGIGELALTESDTAAVLLGQTVEGRHFRGEDAVRIVPGSTGP